MLLKLLCMLCLRNLSIWSRFQNHSSQPRFSPIVSLHSSRVRWSGFEPSWSGWYWDRCGRANESSNWIRANNLSCTVRLNGSVRVNSSRLRRVCLFVSFVCSPNDGNYSVAKPEFYQNLCRLFGSLRSMNFGCWCWFKHLIWLSSGNWTARRRSIFYPHRSYGKPRLLHPTFFWPQTVSGAHAFSIRSDMGSTEAFLRLHGVGFRWIT